jgi:hypothetical protein
VNGLVNEVSTPEVFIEEYRFWRKENLWDNMGE